LLPSGFWDNFAPFGCVVADESGEGQVVAKKRSIGILLIILGVLINNYAYMSDVVGNTHEGLIYMGWKGIAAAVLGLVSIFFGTILLVRASDPN
jgi:hypothetical protein